MSRRPQEVLAALAEAGFDEAEVYVKRGRSRRLERTRHTETSGFHHERGWAVRAGTPRASFFAVGTGDPPDGPWPEPDGQALALPPARPAAPWRAPSDLDAPLAGEREGFSLLEAIARELDTELPRSRLTHALLEDGASESEIASSHGIDADVKSRLAVLRLEAVGPGPAGAAPGALLVATAREARRLEPKALARRLADLLLVRLGEPVAARDRGEILLAPAVGQRLLAGLLPLFAGPRAGARLGRFRDRRGHVASERFTLIDDGRLPGGLLAAPVDGEGVPTREVVLVEAGEPRQPLLAWHEVKSSPDPRPPAASGIARRASFRDLPTPGPTHLYLQPDPAVSVGSLLGAVARGYYFLDVLGSGRFDFEEDRFALPVAGFSVQQGRAVAPVAGVELTGAISTLLRNLQAVGRDLQFAPLGGMIGAPTVLVTGLEVRGVGGSS